MIGRPPVYSPALAERILIELGNGRTLNQVCADDGVPCETTVRKWIDDDVDGFAARYRRARRDAQSIVPGQARYSREISDEVTDALALGRPLSEICMTPGMPTKTSICRWVAEDRDGFAARYRLARHTGHGRTGQIAHSAEIEEWILTGLMNGRTLTDICSDPDMPSVGSVQNWLAQDRDGFGARYRWARELGCDVVADEMVDIADDRSADWIVRHHKDGSSEAILDPERVARARLRLEARRWRLAKFLPRSYGDRLHLTAGRDNSGLDAEGWAEVLKAVDGKSRGLPNKVRRIE